jgi:hypothetical protein
VVVTGACVVGAGAGVGVVPGAWDVVAGLDPVSRGTVVPADGVVVAGVLARPDVAELGTSEVGAADDVSAGVVTGETFPAGVPDDVPDVVSAGAGGTYSSPAMTNSAPSTTVDVRALPMRLGTERGQMRRRVVAGAVVTCGEVVARWTSVGSSVPAGSRSGAVLTMPPRWSRWTRRSCSR